ncbi:DUF6542 domain-containing protein [Kitasatospora sp. NPDC004289]
MEQSIRTQPPGPRRRPPSGPGGAAVPGPSGSPESRGGGTRGTGPRSGGPLRLPLRLAARARGGGGNGSGANGGRSGPPARLTAVGTGLLALVGTLVAAGADRLVFGGLGVLFGLGYVAVCFQLAVRVRLADLPAAPISGPIAFAVALLVLEPVAAPGVTGQVVGLASGLALRAGWLFTGTGLAAVIVAARFLAQRRIRRARRAS